MQKNKENKPMMEAFILVAPERVKYPTAKG